MLASLVFLFLSGATLSMGKLTQVSLDLAKYSRDQVVVDFEHFDNVVNFYLKPLKGMQIVSVSNGNEKLWESSHEYERANYVLLSMAGSDTLLYISTELNGYKPYYFFDGGEGYFPINFDKYVENFNLMKNSKVTTPLTLNLNTTESSSKLDYDPTTNFKDYETYTPKRNYVATSVYYDVRLLWKAEVEDHRAVAVWVYKKSGTRYLVRILVSNKDSEYRFFNFIRVGNNWVNADSSPFTFLHEDDTKFPPDFHYPHYLFGKNKRNLFGNDKPFTTKEDFLDESFEFRPESKRSDHDFSFHNAPIPYSKCSKLDFSKRVPSSLGSSFYTKFDKVLPMTSVYPKSGNFFSRVSDGSLVIFDRNLDNEACVGVHFYYKDKKYYLADVLVSSPTNPRSEYHVKDNGSWTPISKESFLSLMAKISQKM